jgi:hypothetical protein
MEKRLGSAPDGEAVPEDIQRRETVIWNIHAKSGRPSRCYVGIEVYDQVAMIRVKYAHITSVHDPWFQAELVRTIGRLTAGAIDNNAVADTS